MAESLESEGQRLSAQLHDAWTAEVPNVAEIRRCQEQLLENMLQCVINLMEADTAEPTNRVKLRVIKNDFVYPSIPRGICSPVKTKEIREFEGLMRSVFGELESCVTVWQDEDSN